MNTKELKDEVKNKFVEYGIEIFDEFSNEDGSLETIMAENLVVNCDNGDSIILNFHLSSSPSYAARIVLILREISDLKDIEVSDDFLFDREGNYLDGEEAIKYDYENIKKNIIDDFIEEQYKIGFLLKAKTFNC